ALAFWINWQFVAPRLRSDSESHRSVTIPGTLAASASPSVRRAIRVFGAMVILVMLTTYVSAQFTAAGKAFQETFGLNYQLSVLLSAMIVVGYTLLGGFRAVAWTDVAQATLMVVAVVVLPLVMLYQVGGPFQAITLLRELEPVTMQVGEQSVELAGGASMMSLVGGNAGWALLGFLSVWLGIPLGNFGQPHMLVRIMATRDDAAIARAKVISTVWVIILFSGAIAIGLLARIMFGETVGDPEKALPYSAVQLLPAPLAGLMLAAIVAAMCSTADSQLLVAGSGFSLDLRNSREDQRRNAGWINRALVLALAIIATILAAAESKAVFSLVLYAWDGLGAAFGPVLLLKLFWKRTTGPGILAGMVCGFVVAIVWRETLHAQLYSLIPAFVAALVTATVVSLAYPAKSTEV
ncbi:MAG TPA: hypothetical protein DDW52_27885, partial [Planctomycetaceae bacterium]|nr:hypothetical protein [Planctomycetaceae bacterium]